MRWVHRIQHSVEARIRNKGSRYFVEGAVTLISGSSSDVRASVQGTNPYIVKVQLDGDALVAECECPYFESGDICKHVWATLLAAESKTLLTRIGSAWSPHVISAGRHESNAHDFDFTHETQRPARLVAPKPTTPHLPTWQGHLAALRRSTPYPDEGPLEGARRVQYFVDVADCMDAGALIVQAVVSRLKKNGEWGKPGFQEAWIRDLNHLDHADRQILALLAPATSASAPENGSVATRHRLPPAAYEVLLPLLCSSGRFFLRTPNEPDAFKRLSWDDGAAWQLRIGVTQNPAADSYVIDGLLKRGHEERSIADPLLFVPGAVFFADCVSRFDDKRAFHWLSVLRKSGSLTIPVSQRAEFISEIAQFSELPSMDLPEDLRMEVRPLAGPPELKIRSVRDAYGGDQRLHCEITFDYGCLKVAEHYGPATFHDKTLDRVFIRDREGEATALARLVSLGVRKDRSWNHGGWELPTSRMPAVVRELVAEGWRVEAEGRLYRRSGNFKIEVTSGIDWLELRGGVEFEGHSLGLPELLRAVAKGERMVRLDDGSFGLVPEEWLARYRYVAGLGRSHEGHIRFTRGQAGLLDALLASQPEVTFDESFRRVREELETFAGVHSVDPPSTFNGRLRDYQREGLGWLRFLRRVGFGGCLADDMGLGKTVQVLALLDSDERRGPVLVVVPRSLVFNWKQEAERFTPRLHVLDFTGNGRKGRWGHINDHDIVLTTYGTMRRDTAQLKDVHFDTIILDEAQAIKNPSTEAAKAARLLKADHRLALTGTPIENHLGDLWSLFEFLNPGLLGSASVFRAQTSRVPSEQSAEILAKALRPFILRRKKEQVARELPPKTEQTIYCELEAKQRKLYNELREHYRSVLLGRVEQFGLERSRMHILEALLRLRQAACHPGLIDKARTKDSSAKLESLLPQIQEVVQGGHKALVFSQFTSLLAIVRNRLDEEHIPYEYLDGRTRDREASVRRFQEDADCPLFLISLKAGGLGLNLTAAEYVFLLDPWWNPAVEAQAIDRSHRIGQSRHVFAYRLIAKDTVEEKVLELQKSKRDLADSIITAENSILTGLDRGTLELLLS